MNKILMFSMLGLFAVSLVTALSFYAIYTTTITVTPAIVIEGDGIIEEDMIGGEAVEGNPMTVTNDAPSERSISITDDSGEDVSVEYVGTLELSKKAVDFGNEPWDLGSEKVEVKYTVIGDEFNAEATSPIAGYELIYYKDNSDRFNDPANAIAVADVSQNLPYDTDGNADEYDMCEIEGYLACHGAKIWYVPSDAMPGGVIDWSRAGEFYFETKLIQYNAEGDIIMYPGMSLEITPIYTPSNYLNDTVTIETKIA